MRRSKLKKWKDQEAGHHGSSGSLRISRRERVVTSVKYSVAALLKPNAYRSPKDLVKMQVLIQ